MIEVIVETKVRKIKTIQFRATHARFDKEGKADLHYAAQAIAVILEGATPKILDKNVFDISPTLQTRKRERETQWRIPQSLKRLIAADIHGQTRLPRLRVLS